MTRMEEDRTGRYGLRAEAAEAEGNDTDQADAFGADQRTDDDIGMGSKVLANVYRDPTRHTVTLLMDDKTAEAAMYAVLVLIANLEAHAREVRLVGAMLPPDSYGANNRHAIAARHERMARRLRELEAHYRDLMITPGKGLEA